ncbi:MAG: hypothetical protein AAB413_03395 [Patescibacteria group bacterium]
MKFISTKELRTDLPAIRKQLAKGQEFFLIYQSKPIAKISPIQDQSNGDVTFVDIERAAIEDMGDDFLTQKEVDYYLSLPDYETR